jgi:hypothetical protein
VGGRLGSERTSKHRGPRSAVSGRRLLVAVDHRGAGGDTTYINEDPRGFHLEIESAGLDWSLDVSEGIPARHVRN